MESEHVVDSRCGHTTADCRQDGQDLIEYALFTGAIGFAGVAGVGPIGLAINALYSSWDTGVNQLVGTTGSVMKEHT